MLNHSCDVQSKISCDDKMTVAGESWDFEKGQMGKGHSWVEGTVM